MFVDKKIILNRTLAINLPFQIAVGLLVEFIDWFLALLSLETLSSLIYNTASTYRSSSVSRFSMTFIERLTTSFRHGYGGQN